MALTMKKLHSRRGASILLALFLVLVVAMISAVIISGAITAKNRVHDDSVSQQNELTLTSAGKLMAQFFRDRNEAVRYTVTEARYKDQVLGSQELNPEPEHLLKKLQAAAGSAGTLEIPSPAAGMRKAVLNFTVVPPSGGGTGEYNVRGTITLEKTNPSDPDPKLYFLATFTYSSDGASPKHYTVTDYSHPIPVYDEETGDFLYNEYPEDTATLTTETWNLQSVQVTAAEESLS